MPFDPQAYENAKKSLKPATAGGFDPTEYARVRAQVAAPPQAQARPGSVGRAFDFARRALMGNRVEPSQNNPLQNAMGDAGEIITGTSHMIGQGVVEGGKLVKDVGQSIAPMVMKNVLGVPPSPADISRLPESPIGKRIQALPGQVETAFSPEGRKIATEDFIKPAVESFGKSFGYKEGKELIKHPSFENTKKFVTAPIKQLMEHPLFTLIDWSTAVDALGGAARGAIGVAEKGASLAGKAELADKLAQTLSTARAPLEVAPRGEILREFSKNPIVKMGIQQPLDKVAGNPAVQEFLSSNPVLKWLAPDSAITPEARAGRVAEKVASKSQSEFYRMRNARMDEAMAQFNKLPEGERQSFVAIIQGRAVPRQMSPQFKEVYDWYKNTVADEQAKFNLADETVKRVAYQPLAVANGLLSPEDYKLALRGDTTAIGRVRKVTEDLSKARVRVQEDAIKDWMGANTSMGRRTKQFKSLATELAQELSPDPIYFPSVFADKLRISDFLPNKFLQRFKPGFLKGRSGAFGFIEKDPEAAFAVHQSQVERYLQNETLITAIKDKFALPLKKATELKPGWKPFAPDGYIGFYRGSMPLQEAFLRGVGMGQNVDDAFTAAIHKVMPMMVEDKNFVGVRKPNLYQVPAEVAQKLQDAMAPQSKVPEAFKLIWDKPLQAFKFSVLAMSPRWVVNNTLGNIVTTMSGRVSPESFIKAGQDVYKDIIPAEVGSGGFRRAEFPGIKKIITPQTGMADKVTGFFSGATPTEGVLHDVQNVVSRPVKAIGKIADTVFEANSKIEDAFRNATFIDKTTKAAVEQITKDTSKGIFDMKTSLDKFLQKGSFADSNVAKVAKEMLQDEGFKDKMVGEVNRILNDYNSLSKFERGVIRRAVPFWSWWKFVNVMFWSMPVKDPIMAQTIKQLGNAGLEIAKDEWKANGLNINEIPEWMKGNVILGKTDDKKLLQMLNTRSLNPFSSAKEWPPSLAPQFQVMEERRTGRNYLTNAPFTHPNEAEVKGSTYRMNGKDVERIDHPTPPPILSHIARQFPQTNIMESLMFPYKTYSGEGIFNNAAKTYRGKEQPINPAVKMSNILGMPVTETDLRRLKSSHIDASQAERIIKSNMRRSNKSLERIKLGKGQ